jgi:hypothetical protein
VLRQALQKGLLWLGSRHGSKGAGCDADQGFQCFRVFPSAFQHDIVRCHWPAPLPSRHCRENTPQALLLACARLLRSDSGFCKRRPAVLNVCRYTLANRSKGGAMRAAPAYPPCSIQGSRTVVSPTPGMQSECKPL